MEKKNVSADRVFPFSFSLGQNKICFFKTETENNYKSNSYKEEEEKKKKKKKKIAAARF